MTAYNQNLAVDISYFSVLFSRVLYQWKYTTFSWYGECR